MFGVINNGHHYVMKIQQEREPVVVISFRSIILSLGLGFPRSLMSMF